MPLRVFVAIIALFSTFACVPQQDIKGARDSLNQANERLERIEKIDRAIAQDTASIYARKCEVTGEPEQKPDPEAKESTPPSAIFRQQVKDIENELLDAAQEMCEKIESAKVTATAGNGLSLVGAGIRIKGGKDGLLITKEMCMQGLFDPVKEKFNRLYPAKKE